MDELNLEKFKELIGELEPSNGAKYDLDDIMKEVAEAEESLDAAQPVDVQAEDTLPEDDAAEEPEGEPDETPEQPDDEETEESADEMLEETDEAEEETELPEEESAQPVESGRKKRFWDSWVVPEEEIPQEIPDEEEPERVGFFASLFEGAVEDKDIEEEDETEDVFQEKQPKRHFWDRWLAPESLDEEQPEQPVQPEEATELTEETIAIPSEEPVEELEPAAPELEATVVFEPAPEPEQPEEPAAEPEEDAETKIFDSIAQAASESRPAMEFDTQAYTDVLDQMTAEQEPEAETEPVTEEKSEPEEAAETMPEEEEEPAFAFKKPSFLNKWFAPINEAEEPAAEEQPEETAEEAELAEEEEILETADDLPTPFEPEPSVPEEPEDEFEPDEMPEEPEQTISQEEFEAFLREADEQPEERTSFAELMRESGVDWREDAPQAEAPVVSEDLTSQVVYLELNTKEEQTEPADAGQTEESLAPGSVPEEAEYEPEYEPEETERPAKSQIPSRPEPEWLHLPLERIGEIAPKVERIGGEPVLMSEIRRLEREKELQKRAVQPKPQPAEPTPHTPRPVFSHESEQTEDGGDDEVSGGHPPAESEHLNRTDPPNYDPVVEPEEPTQDDGGQQPQEEMTAAEETPEARPAPRKKKSGFQRWITRRRREQEEQTCVPKSAKEGFQQWKRIARSTGRRSIAVGILTLLALYLSCTAIRDLPIPQAISYADAPQNFYLALIVMTVLSMLIAWDVLRDGIKAVIHLHADFCTLITLTLIMTIVHSAVRMSSAGEEISYPCVAMAALFALMRARVAQAGARRNTYKMAALNRAPIGVFLHREPKPHLVKRRLEDNQVFLACTARDGWYSRIERLYTPVAIVAAAVLAWIISAMTKDQGRFVYTFSALLTAASQIGLLTAVAFGSVNTTRRLIRDDAALAGLASAVRLSNASQVVMTEEDLFPAGSILIDDYVDIRGAMQMDDVLAYAAAVEGDSAVGRVLKEKIHQRYGDQIAAHDHVHYENGGNGARIGDREVLFGTAAFMQEMKIPIPALADEEDHLFLAVDGTTEAVFEIEYVATTQVYTALQSFAERHISVLFQAGDCYLSVERLCDLFGLQPGMIHMPEPEQERQLMSPEYTGNDTLLAILTRDGAAPYSDCVDAAYSLRRLTGGGMLLGTIAAAIDLALMSYLCYVFAPLGASPLRVLLYSLLWFIPIFFIENEAKRG